MITQASSMSEFAPVVGIDWADRKHDICVLPPASNKRESCVLVHRPEAIAQWAEMEWTPPSLWG
jgi:hypothetical protein